MSQRHSQRGLRTPLGVALGLWIGLTSSWSTAWSVTLPKTPNPCAADGVCRPNRETWGYSHTRWRPWPGELAAMQPTPAEPVEAEIEDKLPVYQPPDPTQEDLRGPPRPTPSASTAEPPTTEPDAGAIDPFSDEVPIPDIDPVLPEFEPQGRLQALPPTEEEDSPPALPGSLQQALLTQQQSSVLLEPVQPVERQTVEPLQRSVEPASPATRSTTDHGSAPTVLANPASRNVVLTNPQAVTQTNWAEATDIGLENPAATSVAPAQKPERLQQAIYYESIEQ